MPIAVLKNIPKLADTAWKKTRRDHERKAYVQAPEGNPDVSFGASPLFIRQDLALRKNHESHGKHSECPHEGGMAMVWREHGADFEIAHDRKVDEEAEDCRTDEVPKSHGHEKVERPLVRNGNSLAADFALRSAELYEIPCIESQQGEWHHFES